MADWTPNTATQYLAADANGQRILFMKGMEMWANNTDYWKSMESASKQACIWVKKEVGAGDGSIIRFTNRTGLYGLGTRGDRKLEQTDFEKNQTKTYSLSTGYLRHQTAYTVSAKEIMGWGDAIEQGIPDELGKWLGRTQTDETFFLFRNFGGAANTKIVGQSSIDKLTASNTLSYDAVVDSGQQLKTMAGLPAYVGSGPNGQEIKSYVFHSTSDALATLKKDSNYTRNLRDADDRGKNNYVFTGQFAKCDSHIVSEYTPVMHDGWGPVGSVLAPMAELGTALTNTDAASTIDGGGSATAAAITMAKYYRYFPNYAYDMGPNGSITTSGSDYYYVVIVNNSGADKGKWGMYKYTLNDGDKLTVATGGALKSGTDLGTVTWDAAKNTRTHPSGSSVYLVNALGVPYGWSIMTGAGAVLRGYGTDKEKITYDFQDGGFYCQVYLRHVYGQILRQDARARTPSHLLIAHAINIPGVTITPTYA